VDGRQETWIDKVIREATERGEFDDLPGAGKPLDLSDTDDPDWWVKRLIRREHLDTAALLPPRLALRRERETLPEQAARLTGEPQVRALAEDFNDRVREALRRPDPGPPVVVALVDVDALVADWGQARGQAAAPPSDQGRPADVVPRRRRWRRRRR